MSQHDLVTTREAMEILGYSDPSTVNRMVRESRLTPAMRLPGKRGALLFNRTDIEAKAREIAEAKAS